ANHAEPVKRIELTDSPIDAGLRPVLLSWENAVRFPGGGADGAPEPAAHVVPLARVTSALSDAVRVEPAIRTRLNCEVASYRSDQVNVTAESADGSVVCARLAIAADGPNSFLRRSAGIKSVGWPYSQIGIAVTVVPERDHGGVAVQHFLPAGPF